MATHLPLTFLFPAKAHKAYIHLLLTFLFFTATLPQLRFYSSAV